MSLSVSDEDVLISDISHWFAGSHTRLLTNPSAHSLIHSVSYPPIHPPAHSLSRSFMHLLTVSFVHSLAVSFARSPVHSFIHSLTHGLTHSLARSLTHFRLFIFRLTVLLAHSCSHSLSHSLAGLFTHSLTHSLTDSLTHATLVHLTIPSLVLAPPQIKNTSFSGCTLRSDDRLWHQSHISGNRISGQWSTRDRVRPQKSPLTAISLLRVTAHGQPICS